jgi:hypothetical protein
VELDVDLSSLMAMKRRQRSLKSAEELDPHLH